MYGCRSMHAEVHKCSTYGQGVGGGGVGGAGEEIADAEREGVVVGAVDEELLQPPV